MKKVIIYAMLLSACGGAAPSSSAVHRTLWTLLRGACAYVEAHDPPAETSAGGESDGGVP